MHDGFIDTRKPEYSKPTMILWRFFLGLLIFTAAILLLALPATPLSAGYYILAGVSAVFCVIFLVLYVIYAVADNRRQFGTLAY